MLWCNWDIIWMITLKFIFLWQALACKWCWRVLNLFSTFSSPSLRPTNITRRYMRCVGQLLQRRHYLFSHSRFVGLFRWPNCRLRDRWSRPLPHPIAVKDVYEAMEKVKVKLVSLSSVVRGLTLVIKVPWLKGDAKISYIIHPFSNRCIVLRGEPTPPPH